jgi:hypothetical protein
VRQHLRIQPIRLGQASRRPSEVAYLARVDDRHGQAGKAELCRHQRLVAAGRLDHYHAGMDALEPGDSSRDPSGISAPVLLLPARAHRDVQRRFRDINPNRYDLGFTHARPPPTLPS